MMRIATLVIILLLVYACQDPGSPAARPQTFKNEPIDFSQYERDSTFSLRMKLLYFWMTAVQLKTNMSGLEDNVVMCTLPMNN